MWEHVFALARDTTGTGTTVTPSLDGTDVVVPFALRLVPVIRAALRIPYNQPLTEVFSGRRCL
jgi:hypothetical protein